jgi:putative hemolysin
MTILFLLADVLVAMLVVLATCIQVLYLESLRLRTRDLPALAFFKETLEPKLGLETETGALTYSLIKHIGLGVIGCLTLAIAAQNVDDWEALVATIILVMLFAVFGTFVIPQIVYRKSSGHGLLTLVPAMRAMAMLIRPLTWGLNFLQSLFDLGVNPKSGEQPTQEEHIEALISAGEEEGLIEKGDRELIQSVVAFNDKTVREVMTPRPRVVAISHDDSLEKLRELVINEQYSRIPVFQDNIDQIVGFVHVRDMFELDDEHRAQKKVRDILRPIRAVPETKPVNDLLRDMQEEGAHMAVVVDEYGATAGIVTMEDLVEEILGEIHDEHEPERDFHKEPDGSYIVSGSFDLGRLADLLDFSPEQDTESTTVGGLVSEWLGHVPAPGEETKRDGICIKVLAANNRRVDQVRVAKDVQTHSDHT